MNRFWGAVALAVLVGGVAPARAATVQLLSGGCTTALAQPGGNAVYINSGGDLCVSASVTASTSATASAAPTPVSAGTGKPLNIDLFSELFTAVSVAGTPVSAGAPFPVTIISGGGTGGTSSTFGLAFPADGTAIGLTDGTNMIALKGSATLGAFVDVTASVLPTGAATAAKQPALGTAGNASTDVLTIQGIASMTKLLVTPDSVALPANQSVNLSQVNGVTTLTGAGATGTGAQRVTVSQDTATIAGAAPTTGITVLPKAGAFTIAGCTVGSSSAQCLAGSLVTSHLQIQNVSTGSTNNIACTFAGTAILNSSGSFLLQPGQSASWGTGTGAVPTGALDCISTAGSAPLYVEYN